jgi:hypothetical protein
MDPSIVSFRKVVVDESVPEKDRVEMDAVEIRLSDANVVVLPATDVNPETGQRYCDLFADKYKAFQNGEVDPDRAAQLKSEIEDRQNELKGRGKDDKRVQENLGYGKVGDHSNPQQAKVAAGTKDKAAEKSATSKKAS